MTYTESTLTKNVHIHQLHEQQLIPHPAIQWFPPTSALRQWLELFAEFRNAWSHMFNLPCAFVAMYLTKNWKFTFLYSRLDSPSRPRLPHRWGFEIALNTTLGRTPPDERSALPNNTQKKHNHPPYGIRSRKHSKWNVADPRAATGIGSFLYFAALKTRWC